ncbi:hypothetical protein NQ317_015024 [Molorchus minor]|uniref:Uncharacterized protein n=1 Tax=Molorchus minor TaxID=1323400 RepID=A0ABQ9K543_9CUCU|nr:hypothetical protein NQ317_015024 [Molorchus minor]
MAHVYARPHHMLQTEEEVLDIVEDDPSTSTREIARLHLENFIEEDLTNVTLTVLDGEVVYEIEDPNALQSIGAKLKKGESLSVEVGQFHKIHTVSSVPSRYMYTFIRERIVEEEEVDTDGKYRMYSPFPLIEDFGNRMLASVRMWTHFGNSALHLLFGRPYELRSKAGVDI